MLECVRSCRTYCEKDKEVVQTVKPPFQSVEWWDESHRAWQNLTVRPVPAAKSLRRDLQTAEDAAKGAAASSSQAPQPKVCLN